jgi:fatty-acyl-CoA synthase
LSVVELLEGIAQARDQGGRIVFLGPDAEDGLGWSEFFAEAERVAAWLQGARGVGPGSRVVVLALPSRAVVTAVVAVWLAGGSVTCAPTPARTTDLATYVEQTRGRIAALGDPLVLLGAPYEELVGELTAGGVRVDLLIDAVAAEPAGVWKTPDLTPADPAILQFTSGTTAAPKIVQISHGNLAANIAAIRDRIRHDEIHGRLLTWLPLSHDMGLIGALAVQLTCGHCDVLLGTPTDYLAAPSSWLRNAARYRATVLMGPASAYALAGRLLAVGPTLDLSSVKVALCGGEPIEPEAIERFLDAAARHGFDREAFLPAYGLAEATLAVAMPPAPGLRVDEVDADVLADQRIAVPAAATGGTRARRLVRLGPALPGLRVRVVDAESGRECPERSVGEIHVAGTSVTAGYLDDKNGKPPADGFEVRRVADGWLATGDLGYLVDGELVVCGRAKDLIIIGGRNVHPEEVEQAAARVPGVRPGNVVSYPTVRADGASTDGLTVAVETRPGHDEATLRDEVTAAVLAAVGIRPAHVHVLPPGSIPKTPSGKLQRAQAAVMFGSGR